MSAWQAEIEAAVAAARAAEAVIRRYDANAIPIERKADASPVTAADRACEREIKRVLAAAFPDHGFYGEEYGAERAGAESLWLIDPIDGTKSFIRATPFFSTQIALLHRGELVVGVSNAPFFGRGELAWAAAGRGAWLNDARLRVSSVGAVSAASVSLGNVASLAASPAWADVGALIVEIDRIRGYGDFCHYHLLAGGSVDAVIESDVNILDIAALSVIVREAGGLMTEIGGGAIGLQSRSVLADNGRLRAALGARLAARDPTRDAHG